MRHSREEKCGRYEKDVEHILDEMNPQDAGFRAHNVCSSFFVPLNLFYVLCGLLLTIFVFCDRLEWNLLVSMDLGTSAMSVLPYVPLLELAFFAFHFIVFLCTSRL